MSLTITESAVSSMNPSSSSASSSSGTDPTLQTEADAAAISFVCVSEVARLGAVLSLLTFYALMT